MPKINRTPVFMIKKVESEKTVLGREITAAVVLKFLLLASLWWLFFKGHKQPVDGDIIATKLFGADQFQPQIQKSSESSK